MSEDDLVRRGPGVALVSLSFDIVGIGVIESESSSKRLLNRSRCRGVTDPGVSDFTPRARGVVSSGMSYMVSSSGIVASVTSCVGDGIAAERIVSMECSLPGVD
jgi:hypothetical protein